MKINTRRFGEIEIDEKKILEMPDGLAGFENYTRFVVLEDPKSNPFCWFQSVEESNLALVVMDPFIFMLDYKLDLKSIMSTRNWKDVAEKDLVVFVVVNIPEANKDKKITANLIGPLVINIKNNEAAQVVFQNSAYSHQHNILES